MKDPHVVRSGAAHEVSMAPGSSVAKSHVAAPRETVVRQNPVADTEYIEEGVPSERDAVSIGKSKQEEAAVDASASVTQNRGRLFTAEPTAAPTQEEAEELAPEMNFPARLIHLRMENEKMRAVLDELEHTLEAS
jgi:hypothetical protein